ncbi:hypothetical protein PYCCODRAFT_1470700 [Trametes coccinea BRFM310]|uniref:C2H2-type domain-containing protein n=1 Tax=Trametes coccinea (strain BRFM310) TaxID=1353009 RepID=A0A1Y2IEW7_TRAC3|nr:hypothetical protein PYCCODRAFT_1470700 [Trametes coccinea BRFM310]
MPRVTKAKSTQPKVGNQGNCPTCGRYCPRDLRRHMDSHEDLSNFSDLTCTYPGCNRVFRQKSNLDTHKLTHVGKRPHACPERWVDEFGNVSQCAASFSDRSCLLRHRARLHGYVPKSRQPPKVLEREAALQQQDAKAYALAIEFNITYKRAVKMVEAEEAGVPIAAQRVPSKKPSRRSKVTPSATSPAPSSSASSSPSSSLAPSPSYSSSSSPESSAPSTPEPEFKFPADIAALFDPASLNNATAGAGWDAPAVADPSAHAFSGNALPQEFSCDLAFTLPQLPAAQFPGRYEQPQYQNFVDVSAEANMLLPSQVPPQYFGVAPDLSLPAATWGAQDASFPFLETDMTMAAAMAAAACPDVPNVLSFDYPSAPFQEPLVPQPSIWDAFFFAPTPPAAPSPQSLTEAALNEFLHGSSA